MSKDFSENAIKSRGIDVPPLPLPPCFAGTWIVFMVQSPAFSSHVLLFAQLAARDLWLATELLNMSGMLQM